MYLQPFSCMLWKKDTHGRGQKLKQKVGRKYYLFSWMNCVMISFHLPTFKRQLLHTTYLPTLLQFILQITSLWLQQQQQRRRRRQQQQQWREQQTTRTTATTMTKMKHSWQKIRVPSPTFKSSFWKSQFSFFSQTILPLVCGAWSLHLNEISRFGASLF